jgi:hypothetical protein
MLDSRKNHLDPRTRRNREHNRNVDFAKQIPAFADAYMDWDLHRMESSPPAVEQVVDGSYAIRIVDAFGEHALSAYPDSRLTVAACSGTSDELLDVFKSDLFIGCTLIRHGVMPSSPGLPSVAITIQTLEFYRLAHFRCPHLSISAFVKALSDNHSVSSPSLTGLLALLMAFRFSSRGISHANSPSPLMFTWPSVPR